MEDTNKAGKFNRGRNNGTATCYVCGKTRQKANMDMGTGLCKPCYEEAGLENEHQDGYHDDAPNHECPMCERPEEQTRIVVTAAHSRFAHIAESTTSDALCGLKVRKAGWIQTPATVDCPYGCAKA